MPSKLTSAEIQTSLQSLHSNWSFNPVTAHIQRTFTFDNYYQTMAFANAVAWIAHRQNHHPDMLILYKTCQINYTTHSLKGLSELDFMCARDIDELIKH